MFHILDEAEVHFPFEGLIEFTDVETPDRMTLDAGRLSCGFDSGTASDGTLQMRMLCTDPEDKESLMYGAQLKLLPGKRIELILEPMDQK